MFLVNGPPTACESNSSSAIPGEYYDSDSSVSLIMDDSVDNDELLGGSNFIEIPRCFVTQDKSPEKGMILHFSNSYCSNSYEVPYSSLLNFFPTFI